MASTRITAPRSRATTSASARKIAGTARMAMTVQEKNGAKSIDQVTVAQPFRTGNVARRPRMVGCRTPNASLAEPFEKRGHMHLIGLVVAGEHVHHDVDAAL